MVDVDDDLPPEQVGRLESVFESWRPEIVCLSGSTRFKTHFRDENARLSLEGKIVLSVGFFHHTDGIPDEAEGKRLDDDGEWKRDVDHLHLRKIDLADRVHVINPGGYIGESTANEIEYARNQGTPISWLEPPENSAPSPSKQESVTGSGQDE